MCNKDFAELSGELSDAICLKILVLFGSALELFRNSLVLFVRFFGFGVLVWTLDVGNFYCCFGAKTPFSHESITYQGSNMTKGE